MVILSCAAGISQNDSIFVSYSDFDTYRILNAGFNFSNADSLSEFSLTGLNSRTSYEKYSKNDIGIDGNFSIRYDNFRFGGLLSNKYIANSTLTRPTANNITIMPLTGYARNGIDLEIAAGYVGKVDEIADKRGEGASFRGSYILDETLSDLNAGSALKIDNLDSDLNYNSSSQISYMRLFEGNFGNFTLTGTGDLHQYHFSDYTQNEFRIKRYEYDLKTGFVYIASDKIRNISALGFYARNKDSYKNSSLLSYNSNSDLSISDELIFDNKKVTSSIKLDFDTGSDKYSLDYEENDKSLSFYNISLSSQTNYKIRSYLFGLFGKYFKHEYKSLSNSNLEDRDILKMTIRPDVSFDPGRKLSIVQSFPLEYYRLINISSQRSGSNYIDRIVNSVTDIRSVFTEELYMTGKIHLRSYYRSYDYDKTFSNSFVIKNYSFGDTLSYKFTPVISAKFSGRYIYEESGNFNFDAFTENPLTYKDHFYTSLAILLGPVKSFKLSAEYYFYEIDSYNFNQNDFNKDELTRVYISHGPKLGINYSVKNFIFFSGLEIDSFRSEDSLLKFRIESTVSFD